MSHKTVYIELTDEQQDALRPLLAVLVAAKRAGRPTMIIGQPESSLDAVCFYVLSPKGTRAILSITRPGAAVEAEI